MPVDGSNSDREVFVLGSWLAGCVLLRGTCEKADLAPCVYRVTCRVDYTSKSMCTGTKKKDESIYYEYDYIILLSKDDLKRFTIKHTCRKKNGNHLKRVKCSNSIKEW